MTKQTKAAPRYKMVPVEPTEEMYASGMEKSVVGRPSVDDESYVRSIWDAMIASAPEQPAPQPDASAVIRQLAEALKNTQSCGDWDEVNLQIRYALAAAAPFLDGGE